MLDLKKIREDFPILNQTINKKQLVYFDNGATTQKPQPVIDIINDYHTKRNSNIHRGVHYLSNKATVDYENARELVRDFINARDKSEIIFTSGTTNSINLLAFSFGEKYINAGDEIIVTEMEHHANIVPWQMLCERKGAKLIVIPFNDTGDLIIDSLDNMINEKTKLISVIHVSNVLGTINPVKKIIDKAHLYNVPVCIDAAQSVQHMPLDVQELDCDFLVFSGHKIYGPTGIGVLYGKEKYLEELPPYQGGGDMVDIVTFEKTTFNILPFKFEAGTVNYIGAIGMAEGLKYVKELGIKNIAEREEKLVQYGTKKLEDTGVVQIFGNSLTKSSVFSFHINEVHPLDAGMVLDKLGIAVRTGTHCAQPIMQHYQVDGMIRASLSFYNTIEEIDYLCLGIKQVKMMFT